MVDLEAQSPSVRNRSQFILAIMALFFPPLPIFLLTGPNFTIWTKEFFISVLLTIFGHLPGFIFSLYIIYKKDTRIEGYTALENDALLANDHSHSHTNHGDHDHGHHHTHQSHAQYTDEVEVVAEAPKDEPPLYDSIASSSNPAKIADAKDTKVQK